jgi:MFS family permease
MDVVRSRRRLTLAVLSLASAGWAFTFGLGVPLGALCLSAGGHSAETVGLATSLYYLGIAVAAPFVPRLMRHGRGRKVVAAGMTIDALTTALFPWFPSLTWCFVLRVLGGVATALCLIPMETQVNYNAEPAHRARDFGVYAFCVALGIGLGQIVGVMLRDSATLGFALGGFVALAMAVLVDFALPEETPADEEQAGTGRLSFGPAFFSLGTAFAQGFLEGTTMTFLSGYLLDLAHGDGVVGLLLATLFLGVVLVQLPGAWTADRLGRGRVVLVCHLIVLAGLASLPWLVAPAALGGTLFVVGACCAALYPLGLALLGESVPRDAMARANAWYLACNCAGSLAGPWLTGRAIDLFGSRAMFAAAGLASALVVVAAALAWLRNTLARAGEVVSAQRAA